MQWNGMATAQTLMEAVELFLGQSTHLYRPRK